MTPRATVIGSSSSYIRKSASISVRTTLTSASTARISSESRELKSSSQVNRHRFEWWSVISVKAMKCLRSVLQDSMSWESSRASLTLFWHIIFEKAATPTNPMRSDRNECPRRWSVQKCTETLMCCWKYLRNWRNLSDRQSTDLTDVSRWFPWITRWDPLHDWFMWSRTCGGVLSVKKYDRPLTQVNIFQRRSWSRRQNDDHLLLN